jgi:hypothetical protein
MARATPVYPEDRNGIKETVPDAVIEGVYKGFGHDPELYQSVLKSLAYDSLLGCYCFHYAGMFVGVELDGHCHT